jgi:hypothetical protein
MTEYEWVYDRRRKCFKKVPAEECPHYGRHNLFTYKRQAGIIKSIFLGRGDEVTIQQYCDNCEYRTGPETRVEE